ncbi:hypothetical protein BVC80_379g31 [Macleaya cordata]|uniref:Uncharacterized protein n=1 Tax=Macleaya cordata TaxID=56857 RepID=A0A200QST6_MACCD|nr:hypothetical protein BVC80_379g31 [Macleaya cordata]
MAADASDHDAMTIHSSMHEDEEEDDDDDDPDDDTASSAINNNDDIDDRHHPHHHHQHHHLPHTLSRLSGGVVSLSLLVSSDSDREDEPGCYSLPATPPRRRSSTRGGGSTTLINYLRPTDVAKQYASENEADHQKDVLATSTKKQRRNWRRRIIRERWLERVWNKKKKTIQEDDDEDLIIQQFNNNNNSGTSHRFSGGGGGGELIGGGGGGGGDHYQAGLVIMTRPTGGRRSLCMDLEEVKACRDLGFELEHERMMLDYNNINISSRISMNSGSTIDTASTSTSTGGNSPIANWRISSPGDDPKDVKARLKVWAQAVALASASHSRLLGELN